MLAELAAANAAFGVIKSFISNGKELSGCAKQISDFVFSKEAIEKNLKKKKAKGIGGGDLEEFMALEQIAEKRKDLESLCRLYAKPGTWDKFIAFESKMRVQRKKEAEQKQRQIAATIKYISWGLIATLSLGGFSVLYFLTEFLKGMK